MEPDTPTGPTAPATRSGAPGSAPVVAPPVDADEPTSNRRRTTLVVAAVVAALVLLVVLHATGVVGPA